MATCACNYNCTGGCKGGCTSCKDTCLGGCKGCSSCSGKNTCLGGCTVTCNWNCTNNCSGGCKGTCKAKCTDSCTGLCNVGCSSSAMAITLDTYLEADNLQAIADLIIFELARRPDSGAPTDTTNLFYQGKSITLADITKLVNNLKLTGQSISAPAAGSVAAKTFGQSLIDKLLAANAQDIPLE